ncbi:ABC transporter ATP-binding protein [Flaviflexus equikiangi]|uniref:ATP-binding cassette domain-containing protein n=1 Tax=Flaviflexus equikiangi TaxID=2758573 RepID=A0ABS2TC22_9ACTO|nr:ATP-binding cassette domain-containing protein [Flaviflexus equikiangi]MBM9432190.1 ATP-binding cassette domain-containing protein [Flaviflexus equikiangi]
MIQFRDVGKTYPDGTVAVHSFSYTADEGKIVALVGASGSGKTTLLRMVNRMVEPSRGSVWVDGEDVSTVDRVALRRSIGYVLQAGGLLPHRTVIDNVATVPMLLGVPRRQARMAAGELLERVGLDQTMGRRYPSQLSGGQQQRVGVARALAANPKVMLMDEPFGAVDPIVRRELQDELKRLQSDLGKTIILVTHDIDEAFHVGHEVVLLREGGEIVQSGVPEEILAHPRNQYVRDFIGADRAERNFSIRTIDGRQIVIDGDGRPAGLLNP